MSFFSEPIKLQLFTHELPALNAIHMRHGLLPLGHSAILVRLLLGYQSGDATLETESRHAFDHLFPGVLVLSSTKISSLFTEHPCFLRLV